MLRLRMNSRRGFSMIELVLVIAIMLAIAAMALPRFLSIASNYQLRSGLDSVAGVLQQTRVNAVRSNATIQVRTASSGSILYGDTDGGSSWGGGEPGAQLPKQVLIKTSGFPGDAYANVSTYSVESQSTAIKFNSRGLPCVVNSGGVVCQNLDTASGGSVPVGFVIYVQNTGKYGMTGWGAVTVSPAGRVQIWVWNGGAYSQQ